MPIRQSQSSLQVTDLLYEYFSGEVNCQNVSIHDVLVLENTSSCFEILMPDIFRFSLLRREAKGNGAKVSLCGGAPMFAISILNKHHNYLLIFTNLWKTCNL